MRTHGSSCRRRASSSPRRVCSFSALSSSIRAASQSFRVPVTCFVIAVLLSWLPFGGCRSRDKLSAGCRDDGSYKCGGIQGLDGLADHGRSEEHTSELQSQSNIVCRLLLEKKKNSKERH